MWANTIHPFHLSHGGRVKPAFKSFFGNYLKSLTKERKGDVPCCVCGKTDYSRNMLNEIVFKERVYLCMGGNCWDKYEKWLKELQTQFNDLNIKPYF